jgi:hypothetical protein
VLAIEYVSEGREHAYVKNRLQDWLRSITRRFVAQMFVPNISCRKAANTMVFDYVI